MQNSLPSGSAMVYQECGPSLAVQRYVAPRASRAARTSSLSAPARLTSQWTRFFTVLASGAVWNKILRVAGLVSRSSGGRMAAPVRQTSLPWCSLVSDSVAKPCSIMERMKSSSWGSTAQSRVSAHHSARPWGSVQSTAIWMFNAMGRTYDAGGRGARSRCNAARGWSRPLLQLLEDFRGDGVDEDDGQQVLRGMDEIGEHHVLARPDIDEHQDGAHGEVRHEDGQRQC